MSEDTNNIQQENLLDKIAKLLNVQYVTPISPTQVRSLHKALPGYQAIGDDAVRVLQGDAPALKLDDALFQDLKQVLSDVERLEPAEQLLEKLYLSVYHQRLQATDRAMGDMYLIARRVRDFAEAEPEISRKAHFLTDFMKAFRPGRKKKKGEE
uniref:Uncharacterized protein n=1 Tax=Candidatus Kentrum sp. DK TaxID=2126562 RepID=A0A450S0V4_9GAMM|nr:MAG: hypothetical protein BECKDK2373B_GA0170837_101018 [Candidatus Kentron sp. DK]